MSKPMRKQCKKCNDAPVSYPLQCSASGRTHLFLQEHCIRNPFFFSTGFNATLFFWLLIIFNQYCSNIIIAACIIGCIIPVPSPLQQVFLFI